MNRVKRGFAVVCAMLAIHFAATALRAADVPLTAECNVHFATVEEAQAFVTAHDMYLDNLSPLDREIRLRSGKPVSEAEYQAYASKQMLAWNQNEMSKLTPIVASAAKKLGRWKLPWPKVVTLIKSTGDDEAHTAHCRGNAVVLPLAEIGISADRLEPLLIHELFHVLSRNNPELRDKLYAVIGFEATQNIELPDALKPRRLTNPDAPLYQHAVKITVNGHPTWVTPILLGNADHYDPRRGGQLFDYLRVQLLVVEKQGDNWVWQPADGKPQLIDPKTSPGYFERIGRNTNYIIHPEEIIADNFQFLVSGRANLPSPKIAQEIDRVLSAK